MPPPEHYVTVQAEFGGRFLDAQSGLHAVLVVEELVFVVHPVQRGARQPGEGLYARLAPIALLARRSRTPAAEFLGIAIRALTRLLYLVSNKRAHLVPLGEAAYGLVQLMDLVRAQALERVREPLEIATAHGSAS